jgi:hypothetical protein
VLQEEEVEEEEEEGVHLEEEDLIHIILNIKKSLKIKKLILFHIVFLYFLEYIHF